MTDTKIYFACLTKGGSMALETIEFLPVEPSNYVWVAGWVACDRNEVLVEGVDQTDYFITEDGNVYLGDDCIGVVPEIQLESILRERELDNALSDEI